LNSLNKPVYKRVILKLSGEVMGGEKGFGIDFKEVRRICEEIKEVHNLGVQMGIVIGGGNIFRGAEHGDGEIDRVTGDYIGMLGTVINSLALQNVLENMGVQTRVLSAIEMKALAEPYIRRRAIRHMEKGRVVVFAGGTGSPYFSTDTASSLRAVEVNAEVILKGTKVNGVFDADPFKVKSAKMFSTITYMEALQKNLKVMDATAFSMCMDNRIPIIVFNITVPGNLLRIICGEKIGTIVKE
jgi:uridylate kinase